MMKKLLRFLILVSVLGLFLDFYIPFEVVNAAQSVVTWPTIEVTPYIYDLSSPIHVTHAGDGSNRLFVVERVGNIQIVKGGALLETPFLDIQDRVNAGGEEGLLSVAFPPDYATKGYFYVYYTNHNGDNQVSRFYVSNDLDVADPSSEELILYLDHPTHSNHNGGQLMFGPDGYLYIGTGDGGGGGDPDGNAQDPASLLGKMLRIDVEFAPPDLNFEVASIVYLPLMVNGNGSPTVEPYRIPSDNPFVNQPGYRAEIWALGLRNPWRYSFDRSTGDLYIGDVGQGSWEEVDFQPASSLGGENYGWNEMEGIHCYQPNCETDGMTLPVYEYATHEQGTCAITGGFVYRGVVYAEMQGIYFLADYCNGIITGLQLDGGNWQAQTLLDTDLSISSFGEDETGELYLVDIASGTVYQLREQAPSAASAAE